MRLLLKIGGAQLEAPAPRALLCQAIAAAKAAGHELVVVHGGGNQIRQYSKALAIEDRYHDGLRITDARTAELVLMVLGGLVNRTLVAALQHAGVRAVGLCGADGGTFSARRLARTGVDLGFVGAVDRTDPRLCEALLQSGCVPVLATVAPGTGHDGAAPFFNLNADHAAGPLAAAFSCDALLFLTDVAGVLGQDGRLLPQLSSGDCDRLVQQGVAKGGMIPKLEAALMARRDNRGALVKIAPANLPDCVLNALRPDVGTSFVERSDTETRDTDQEVRHG